MLDWSWLYLMLFSIPADMNITLFYCISYKFRTGSHDGYCTRQLANLSSLTNDATEKQDIESNNQTFEYVNPHQKHLELKLS